jgi:membrane protein required for beta-lactamase induction
MAVVPNPSEADLSWLQWLVGSIAGLAFAVVGGAIKLIFNQLASLGKRMDEVSRGSAAQAESGDAKLWQAIESMRISMEVDRRESAAHRTAIAEKIGSLSTRDDLYNAVDRVIRSLHPTFESNR